MARPEARFFHHVDPEKIYTHVLSALTQANNILINSGLKSTIDPTEGAQAARNVADYHNALHENLATGPNNTELYSKLLSAKGVLSPEIESRLRALDSHLKQRVYSLLEETRLQLPKPFQGDFHQDSEQSSI